MRRSAFLALAMSIIALSLLVAGCGGDDDPVIPDPPSVGSIIVNPIPDSLDAPWTLSGPDGYSNNGAGDKSFTGMATGEYVLTWGFVANWIKPSNSTRSLDADATVTFDGTYIHDPGPIPGFSLMPPVSVSMPATFTMGSIVGFTETPHQVTLTGRFNMSSTEVTNAQYVEILQWAYDNDYVTATSVSVLDALDGSTVELLDLDSPHCQISFLDGVFSTSNPDRPVVAVNWYGAASYCDWLSLQEGITRAYIHCTWSCNNGNPYNGPGYRLPTEAEWEFACRGGTTTHFYTGICMDAGSWANYDGGSPFSDCPSGPFLGHSADVGSYPANDWGLYEMSGNVWEWCNDWFGAYSGDETDPMGAASGEGRVMRGGSWDSDGYFCRSANRFNLDPNELNELIGFRPVRSAP